MTRLEQDPALSWIRLKLSRLCLSKRLLRYIALLTHCTESRRRSHSNRNPKHGKQLINRSTAAAVYQPHACGIYYLLTAEHVTQNDLGHSCVVCLHRLFVTRDMFTIVQGVRSTGCILH